VANTVLPKITRKSGGERRGAKKIGGGGIIYWLNFPSIELSDVTDATPG